MKKYKKIKKLEAAEFRRLTSVKPETFLEMVAILQQAETIRMSRGGKPHRFMSHPVNRLEELLPDQWHAARLATSQSTI